ncbi:MAG: AAA family ATPase [Bdellovibrionales bacterium]|nr:AAA family ATPase [Bdellovibrionales bacterium]
MSSNQALQKEVDEFAHTFSQIRSEVERVIVGMEDIVQGTLCSILAGGHVLLEGVPGLGKTLLVKSIANTLGLSFKRIQFTPDLMPSDVTGTQVLSEGDDGRRGFVFKPGPIFANVVLADEINRATPKTQAALLEAMEEKQATVLGDTYKLDQPFFVLATQNPVELEGTYPLPEAQLDRFLVKLILRLPDAESLKTILTRTTGSDVPSASSVFPGNTGAVKIEGMKSLVRKVLAADPILEILVRIISALTPGNEFATEKVNKYIRFGPGPRGAQAVMLFSKVNALLDSRMNVSFEDLRVALLPALRHRLVLNFHAEADGVTADDIIIEIQNAK